LVKDGHEGAEVLVLVLLEPLVELVLVLLVPPVVELELELFVFVGAEGRVSLKTHFALDPVRL
jgi:hypothetical protein